MSQQKAKLRCTELILVLLKTCLATGIAILVVFLVGRAYAVREGLSQGFLGLLGLFSGVAGGFCAGRPAGVSVVYPGLSAIATYFLLSNPFTSTIDLMPLLFWGLVLGFYGGSTIWYVILPAKGNSD